MTAVEPGGARVPADPERLAEAEAWWRQYIASSSRLRHLAVLLLEYDRRGRAEQELTAHWYRDRDEMLVRGIEIERLRAEINRLQPLLAAVVRERDRLHDLATDVLGREPDTLDLGRP